MSGHGHGFGYGLNPPAIVGGGGGGGGAAVDSLSNLEVWLDAESYTGGTAPGPNVTTGHPANKAVGGSALTMLSNAANHPYKCFGAVGTDGGGPVEIPSPNGENWWLSAESRLDSALGNHNYFEHQLTTPVNPVSAWSLIVVFFMHSVQNLGSKRNFIEAGGAPWGQFVCGGNCNANVSDDSGNYTVRVGSSAEIGDAWHILVARKSVGGFQMSLDGVEYTDIGNATTANGDINFTYVFKNTQLNTGFGEYAMYTTDHAMTSLEPVASGLATKFGISYTYTPAP